MAFLELKALHKNFGRTVGVDSINLAVEQGEFVSFLGPSGCGKTTTLRMIAGFEEPTSGQIWMDGVEITNQKANQRHIGMVFQSYALFPNMTVADNIGFGMKVAGRSAQEIRGRVAELLGMIRLEEMGTRYPWQLSGGQQQRVALARALAIQPKMLLLDEPLSALDAKIRVSLRNEIRSIQRQLGITTIYVTHDQEEALSLSDRVVVMNLGRIEQMGNPSEIYNFPQTQFVASFVGTLNILPAVVMDAASGLLSVQGHQIKSNQPLPHHTAGDRVALAIRPEMLALDDQGIHDNQLQGTLENISFLGAIVRLQLRVDDTLLTLDEFNNPHLTLPPLGATLTFTFPASACYVLKESDSQQTP